MVTITDSDGMNYVWEWLVNPFTREVVTNDEDISEIYELLMSAEKIIMHNSMFDIPALSRLGIEVPSTAIADTLWMSHAWKSCGPHGLKERANLLYGLPQSDEHSMDASISAARSVARSINLKLEKANEGNQFNEPPFIQLCHANSPKTSGKQDLYLHKTMPVFQGSKGAKKSDMWLPKSIWALAHDMEFRSKVTGHLSPSSVAIITEQLARFVDSGKISPKWEDTTEIYGSLDSERTILVYDSLKDASDNLGLDGANRLLHDLTQSLTNIHNFGISISETRLRKEISRFEKTKRELFHRARSAILNEHPGIPTEFVENLNLASPSQLTALLYGIKISTSKGEKSTEEFEFNFGCPILAVSKKTGDPATGKDILEKLYKFAVVDQQEHANRELFIRSLFLWRKADKAISYLESYLDHTIHGRLFSQIKQTGTVTTRGASSDPNQQNIGKGSTLLPHDPEFDAINSEIKSLDIFLRRSFGPQTKQEITSHYNTSTNKPDYQKNFVDREWWSLDFEQLQLRIFAYIAPEQSLIDAFNEGWNAHYFTASKIFDWEKYEKPSDESELSLQKRVGKNVNFGFIFGAQPARIEATAKRPGLWDVVTKIFPSATQLLNDVKLQVRRNGFVDLGEYLPKIPEDYADVVKESTFNLIESESRYLNHPMYRLYCDAEHSGVNYIIQGIEGLIVKRAWTKVEKILDLEFPNRRIPSPPKFGRHTFFPEATDAGVTIQVHDEFNFDLPVRKSTFKNEFDLNVVMNENINMVKLFKREMEQAGEDFGITTPVNVDYIHTGHGWDSGKPINL